MATSTKKMRSLGVKCSKDGFDWAVVEGVARKSAVVVAREISRAPAVSNEERGSQLNWIRREVLEIVERYPIDVAAIRVAGGQRATSLLPRAEVDGVVQEALASRDIPTRRVHEPTIRSAFGAKNGDELRTALDDLPVVAGVSKTRRDPVVTALVQISR